MRVAHRSSSGLVRKNNHARFPYIIEHDPFFIMGRYSSWKRRYARMVRCAGKGGLRKVNSLKGNGARSWARGVKQ